MKIVAQLQVVKDQRVTRLTHQELCHMSESCQLVCGALHGMDEARNAKHA